MHRSVILLPLSIVLTLLAVFLAEKQMYPRGSVAQMTVEAVPSPSKTTSLYSVSVEPKADLDESSPTGESAVLVTSARRLVTVCEGWCELPQGSVLSTPALYKHQAPYYFAIDPKPSSTSSFMIRVDNVLGVPSVGHVFYGDANHLSPAFRWRRFFGVDLVLIATGFAAISSVFALASVPLIADNRLILAFSGWMLACLGANVRLLGPLAHFSDKWLDLLGAFFFSVIPVMGLIYVQALWVTSVDRTMRREPELSLIGVSALGLIFFLLCVGYFYPDLLFKGTALVAFASVIFAVIAILRVQAPAASIEHGLLFGAFTLIFVDGAQAYTDDHLLGLSVQYTSFIPIFVAVSFLLYVLRRNRWAQRRLASVNAELHRELDAREREVKTIFAEREEQAKEASILRERQRIMEDIHDGFGGRLFALFLQAEKGVLSSETMALGLKESLQDLRLIVDSMDTADGDLESALGVLRGRIEPELELAGVRLKWSVNITQHDHGFGPRAVLSLYRIIQEGATNVIRHAHAQTVAVSITTPTDRRLFLELQDDGQGADECVAEGRGLTNIRNRVESLGGSVEFITADGFLIRIRLPFGT